MKRPVILLVNPWIHDFAAYDLWARPLGLLVLATRLRRYGWEPRLVDCLDPDHPEMGPIKAKALSHGHFHRTPIPKPEALEGVPRTYCRYGVHPEFIRKDLESMPVPRAILVTSLMTYWYPGRAGNHSIAARRSFPRRPSCWEEYMLLFCRSMPESTVARTRFWWVLERRIWRRPFTGKQGSALALMKIRQSLNSAPVWI